MNDLQLNTNAPGERNETDVLRGRDIVCFSNDWHGDPLSKTHLMRILARDNRVLWVNSIGYRAPRASKADLARAWAKARAAMTPIGEVEPGLFVMNPIALPAYGTDGLRAVNGLALRAQVRRAMKQLQMRRPISWSFLPSASVVAGSLGEDMVIYHCVDEFSAFAGVDATALARMEQDLISRSDLVIVSAESLLASKSRMHGRTVLVRHGVDHKYFRRAVDRTVTPAADLDSLPRPILGYFGLMSKDWFDAELVAGIAREFAHGTVVLIGKVSMDLSALQPLPNVKVLGRRPYSSLASFCRGFDVALAPFPQNDVTHHSNPLKIREYLAAGLPVVSTPVPEVVALGQCRIAGTVEEFSRQISAALEDPGPSRARSDAIAHESWDARVEEIRGHVSAAARG